MKGKPGAEASRLGSQGTLPLARSKTAPELPALYWLGQAGFLIESRSARILIDPYLSDSLAAKYKGTARPHVRMMAAPALPGDFRDIDLVLATHAHSDHLDPGSLGALAASNPHCLFIAPASCAELAVSRGVPRERLAGAQAFASMEAAGVTVHPLPSAHEELAMDDHGRLLCLGYVLELDGTCIFHPGDCAPYPGLLDNLSPFEVDLALLPVNGRDAQRKAAGIPGNFSLEEAVELTEAARFGAALGHHYGMFEFNTIDETTARGVLSGRAGLGGPPFSLAEAGVRYEALPGAGRRQRSAGDARIGG
jgi:L-ascorbate metabolism protein UlaG (beta-lactamase superfamily)